MPLTNAQKQAAHRVRRDAKMARMQTALESIVARLDGNTKPLAVEVHQIATEGLQ
jgi:CelD/BcsL family acetyltransferase involved in cellulose biosynthesis